MNTETTKQRLHNKFNYLSNDEIDELFESAKYIYLDLRFPYETAVVDIPQNEPRAYNTVFMIAVEIAERDGFSSVTAYSENGMSIRYDSTGVSDGIRSRITPKGGVPK